MSPELLATEDGLPLLHERHDALDLVRDYRASHESGAFVAEVTPQASCHRSSPDTGGSRRLARRPGSRASRPAQCSGVIVQPVESCEPLLSVAGQVHDLGIVAHRHVPGHDALVGARAVSCQRSVIWSGRLIRPSRAIGANYRTRRDGGIRPRPQVDAGDGAVIVPSVAAPPATGAGTKDLSFGLRLPFVSRFVRCRGVDCLSRGCRVHLRRYSFPIRHHRGCVGFGSPRSAADLPEVGSGHTVSSRPSLYRVVNAKLLPGIRSGYDGIVVQRTLPSQLCPRRFGADRAGGRDVEPFASVSVLRLRSPVRVDLADEFVHRTSSAASISIRASPVVAVRQSADLLRSSPQDARLPARPRCESGCLVTCVCESLR